MTNIPADYRLRLPGPTAVPERVRQAIALPALNHRGPEFRATFARAVVERDSGMPRFYWDFRKAFAAAEILETPFTRSVAAGMLGPEKASVHGG